MYYNMLLERWDKIEAIDILHFKIARGMKKLLIFNCFCLRNMSRNMDIVYLIGNNLIKYENRLTNNMSFSSV